MKNTASLVWELAFAPTQKIEAQDESAFFWLKKAAAQNHADANFWLGLCYQNTIGTEKDLPLAFANFKNAAEQGYQEAYYKLALCYHNALGTQQNDAQAFQWLTKAVKETGVDPDAYLLLAHLYYFGHGTPQNRVIAYKWYEKAVAEGVSMAHLPDVQFQRAKCYLLGIEGISVNYETGMQCLISAVQNHHAEALLWMEETYLKVAFPYFSERNDLNQCYDFAYKWLSDNVKESPTDFETHFCLGILYAFGKGVAKSHKRAIKHFNKSLNYCEEHFKSEEFFLELLYNFTELYKGAIENKYDDSCLKMVAPFFIEKKGFTIDGYDAGSCNQLDYGKNFSPNGKPIVIQPALRFAFQMEMREYDEFRAFLGRFKQSENAFKSPATQHCFSTLSLTAVDQAEELDTKNQELEDMMSMFAHKFRSPLDTIIYNTTHENQLKVYTEAAQTMRGLLDIFSIISTDPKILKKKMQQDNQGTSHLCTVFRNALDMIILHLLSASSVEKIQQHYMRYAKAHCLCDSELTYKIWYDDYYELEQQLQAEWELSYAQLTTQSAELKPRLEWLEEHFFKLDLLGFDTMQLKFKEHGITGSFLTILLNEILVNAFKYYSSATKQVVTLEWVERDDYQVLICRNPSIKRERTIIKGSHKGHAFLSALARKTGSQFIKPILQDDFVIEFGIPNELLKE